MNELLGEQLPHQWHTDRLVVRDAAIVDVPRLTAIFNACEYVGEWDETFYAIEQDVMQRFVQQSMSDDEDFREFRLQCVLVRDSLSQDSALQDSSEIIGYFHCYHNLPKPHYFWISMFVFHPDFHDKGFGSEVVKGLCEQLTMLAYKALRTRVYLKNWTGLRFWIDAGFTSITQYKGDATFAADAYASLRLERALKPNQSFTPSNN